jgi:hypothetical protein
MAGTTWFDFTAGTKAKSSEVDANFDWLEGSIVPMNAGLETDAAYDLGRSTARWRDAYLSRKMFIGAAGSAGFAFKIESSGTTTAGNGMMGFGNSAASQGIGFRQNASGHMTLETLSGGTWFVAATFDRAARTMQLSSGASIDEFSTDGTLAGNLDTAVPTEKAVKTYVDNKAHDVTCTAFGTGLPGGGASAGTTLTTSTITVESGKRVLILATAQVNCFSSAAGIRSPFLTANVTLGGTTTSAGFASSQVVNQGSSQTGAHLITLISLHSPGTTTVTYSFGVGEVFGTFNTCASFSLCLMEV